MKLNLQVLCFLLVILCLVHFSLGWWGSSSSSSSSSRSRSSNPKPAHDVKTKQGLRVLHNKKVVKSQRFERPISGSPFEHSGVVVTTKDGKRHLVHKGKGYGESGQTVVVDAKHMNRKNWKATEQEKPVSGANVGEFVKKGGKDYNVLTDNCHDASERMQDIEG